jgi:8-oxo-dGTP diphosphatase
VTILLVRHGRAGSRKNWDGPDEERPLSKKGQRQAEGLVELLGRDPVKRVLSSPYVRCVQTVEPLARTLGLEVELRPELAEGAPIDAALALVRDLAGTTAVLCSHGDIVPALVFTLADADGVDVGDDPPCAKGSAWELEEVDGRVKAARYLAPAG